MLTDEEKRDLERQWLTRAAYFGSPPQTIYPPKIGQVYAFEMQDSTVKIGVTQDAQRRIGEVENVRCLDVLRVHATDFAPYDFMTKLEIACHKAFEGRRVRGEYFDITFEEAVAELDSHAQEIADAHNKACQRLLDEIDYFFNEFLPEYEESISETVCVYAMKMNNNLVKIGHTSDMDDRISRVENESGWQVTDEHHTPEMPRNDASHIERKLHRRYAHVKVKGEYFNADFDDVSEQLDREYELMEETLTLPAFTNYERGKLLIELIHAPIDSPFKERLAKETANFLLGKEIF